MRIIIQAVRATAGWIQRVLDARVPMDKIYGLRTP
jgi:hypothetical protein